jgi:hypothetical protein
VVARAELWKGARRSRNVDVVTDPNGRVTKVVVSHPIVKPTP